MFLAQIASTAESGMSTGALWLAGLLATGSGATGVVAIISLFATRREVQALEARVEKTEGTMEGIRDGLHEMERRLNKASEERASDTHERINEILEKLALLTGEVKRDHERTGS